MSRRYRAGSHTISTTPRARLLVLASMTSSPCPDGAGCDPLPSASPPEETPDNLSADLLGLIRKERDPGAKGSEE